MNFRAITISTFLISSCSNQKIGDKSVINEGIGVDNFTIQAFTVEEIKKQLGNDYDSINHNSYSIELSYPQHGISVYYRIDSPTKILAMSFNKDFRGVTSKGFSIRNMEVVDMLKIYGEPRWNYLQSAGLIFAHYDSLGIYFSIQPKPGFPGDIFKNLSDNDSINEVRLNHFYDSAYREERIAEISIGLKGTDF